MDDLDRPKKRNLCWRDGCQNKFRTKYMLGLEFEKSIGRIDGKFCRKHFEEAWNELLPYVTRFLKSVPLEGDEAEK